MSCEGKCELVQFKMTASRFLHIEPRPRSDAPPDLEQRLEDQVKSTIETESHTCGGDCDCVIGEPVEVQSRQQIRAVTFGDYTGWYQITVVKYRTPGECMPATDALPADARRA